MRLMVRSMLVLAAAVGLLATGCSSDSGRSETKATEGQLGGMVRTPPLEVAAATMPQVGSTEPFPFKAPKGDLLIVYFGYTSCPDICPSTFSDIRVGLRELSPEQQKRVEVAFVTVDPDRDTPVVMGGYLDNFFEEMPNIRTVALRSEDLSQLQATADTFGVQYEIEDHEPGSKRYEVAHTAVTFVVDDTGKVLVEWPFGFQGVDMGADLKILLAKGQQ